MTIEIKTDCKRYSIKVECLFCLEQADVPQSDP